MEDVGPFGPFWVLFCGKLIIFWDRGNKNTSEHLTALGGYTMTGQAGGNRDENKICRQPVGDYKSRGKYYRKECRRY